MIGAVKILKRRSPKNVSHLEVEAKTVLPEYFEELGSDYISLGQSEAYFPLSTACSARAGSARY